jgi:hypothetical protein
MGGDAGYWILDTGCWIGCSIVFPGLKNAIGHPGVAMRYDVDRQPITALPIELSTLSFELSAFSSLPLAPDA